jgi:hypothetical protein
MSEEQVWWAICGGDFLAALRAVAAGENPDIIYAEYLANCVVEEVDGDDA